MAVAVQASPAEALAERVRVYAEGVASGEIVAGPWVRLAGRRHLDDLEHGPERGLRFDAERAWHAVRFFSFLRLSEGEHAGKPFTLQDWQEFIVASLFGWVGADGYRRFRTAYIEIGKGNGKSPMAAAICLYGLIADGEPGAQVYAAAVTRDQAGIMFTDAKNMVLASPDLQRIVDVNVNNLAVLGTNSFFRPVSSEARSLDGKRVHIAALDEIHEHPSPLVVDKMRAGTKGRRQALILEITNSGYDRHSVCWQHHEYSIKVLQGVLQDDGWFGYVCALDEGDDWTDPSVWPKANPNLGISITYKYLEEQVREAVGMPAKQNIVKRLNFCIWTEQADRWIDLALWDEGAEPIDEDELRGRTCYAGLDLARVHDLSALALVFPPMVEDERWKAIWRFWLPEEDMIARSLRDRVPYDVWVRDGLIQTTPGNATDFRFIEHELVQLAGVYDIREVAYDRIFADGLIQDLMGEDIVVVPFGQGFRSMAAPTAELERLIRAKQLQHGGNPVARWMASNVAIAQDPAGGMKPAKDKSTERIDGIVALIMGIGRATLHAEDDSEPSILILDLSQ